MEQILSIADVVAARNLISGKVVRTPLVSPERLNAELGREVWLKLENFQLTGAFKFRGALNAVLRLTRAGIRNAAGIVTASSGNHGLGIALAGKLCGVATVVVMPEGAPRVKQEKARKYGARVLLHGAAYDDAQVFARQLAEQAEACFIPSFNHPDIMAGQGTIAFEIMQDVPSPGAVVFPIGGGGLAAGVATVFRALLPGTCLIGVQAEGAASMKVSLEQGQPVELPSIQTVADGIAVRRPGDLTFSVVQKLVDEVVTVSDAEICDAMKILMEDASVVVEPASAAAIAAVLTGKVPAGSGGPLVVVITGGNVDGSFLRAVLDSDSHA